MISRLRGAVCDRGQLSRGDAVRCIDLPHKLDRPLAVIGRCSSDQDEVSRFNRQPRRPQSRALDPAEKQHNQGQARAEVGPPGYVSENQSRTGCESHSSASGAFESIGCILTMMGNPDPIGSSSRRSTVRWRGIRPDRNQGMLTEEARDGNKLVRGEVTSSHPAHTPAERRGLCEGVCLCKVLIG
jgi:hypothetical protein